VAARLFREILSCLPGTASSGVHRRRTCRLHPSSPLNSPRRRRRPNCDRRPRSRMQGQSGRKRANLTTESRRQQSSAEQEWPSRHTGRLKLTLWDFAGDRARVGRTAHVAYSPSTRAVKARLSASKLERSSERERKLIRTVRKNRSTAKCVSSAGA
jgi:hypothetical protein